MDFKTESALALHLRIMESLKNEIKELRQEIENLKKKTNVLRLENKRIFQSFNTSYGVKPEVKKVFTVKISHKKNTKIYYLDMPAKTREEAIDKVKDVMIGYFPITGIDNLLFEVEE